jgi:hypothetical protein
MVGERRNQHDGEGRRCHCGNHIAKHETVTEPRQWEEKGMDEFAEE